MTEQTQAETNKENETGLPEGLVNGLTHLHETGLRFLTIVVQPNGELTMHTANGSNRIEITGLLEVARDAIRS
tara:strand:- start:995 stop:1213 length:219 start_codon:yes stop_codon:yes gene_type:complete